MLTSLFLRCLAITTPALARMGFIGESLALWSRARRQRKAWARHEVRCHTTIMNVVDKLPDRRTLIILGSGLLRDVPIDLLLPRFQRIILIDAVHLPHIRWRLRAHKHIEWQTIDLTGCSRWILNEDQGRESPLRDLSTREDIDLVISANVLSQLPIQPDDWLDRHQDAAQRLPENLPACIIRWHLEDLAQFRCQICLLTDTMMEERDDTGRVRETFDLMRGIALPPPDDTWIWPVAPLGEIEKGRAAIHHVSAFENFNASVAKSRSRT